MKQLNAEDCAFDGRARALNIVKQILALTHLPVNIYYARVYILYEYGTTCELIYGQEYAF